ncbi:unnamed protein product, partial [Oppiella nova]
MKIYILIFLLQVTLVPGSLHQNYDNTIDLPSKEELEARATKLEERLERVAARLRAEPRIDIRELATLALYDVELRVLSVELHLAVTARAIRILEVLLNDLEIRVDAEIKRLVQLLDPTPAPSPTKTPAPTSVPTIVTVAPTPPTTQSPITTQTPLDKVALLRMAAELD